ncbi:MAG: 16S rRNA (adenine(1518)-N(6)/adenine(1519)-N(6))-dimethyltransferase RsmA [Minisyncoccota bacterium]
MYAKKSLGQNFLKSERALNSIIEAGDIKKTDTVLEIGPGKGVLTERLLKKAGKVIAVEKDDELYEELANKYKDQKLELIHEDILKLEAPRESYKLIANIPYNITGAIFKKFLGGEHQPTRVVLLVQKEVAERIVARDGKESILSISVKVYGDPKYIERVLAGSFSPAPKVDSAIISIENISKEFFKGFSEEAFFKLLKTGFASKRKKLSSNIGTLYPKEAVLAAFKALNLDGNIRAEDLKLQNWHDLSLKLL